MYAIKSLIAIAIVACSLECATAQEPPCYGHEIAPDAKAYEALEKIVEIGLRYDLALLFGAEVTDHQMLGYRRSPDRRYKSVLVRLQVTLRGGEIKYADVHIKDSANYVSKTAERPGSLIWPKFKYCPHGKRRIDKAKKRDEEDDQGDEGDEGDEDDGKREDEEEETTSSGRKFPRPRSSFVGR